MNRERAETHLRLLAEAELRRSMTPSGGGAAGQRHTPSLALAGYVLWTVGAVDIGVMDEIRDDLEFARAVREPVPLSPARPGPGGSPQVARRLERLMLTLRPPRTGEEYHHTSTPHEPWRVVPIGRVLRIQDDDDRGELHILAYVHSEGGARFTMAGWLERSSGPRGPVPTSPTRPRRVRCDFTATDDTGTTYHLGFTAVAGEGRVEWPGVLELRPDPPHQIRWLDVTTIPGEPATRIDLDPKAPTDPKARTAPKAPQFPAPDITVTQRTVSPGELLLDVVATRLLTVAATFPQDTPEQLAAAKPGLVPHAVGGLGDIIAALEAAGALSPASPVPGQLAGLCSHLGVSGHRITAPPARDLPAPWRSMLTRYHRRQPQAPPAPGRSVATAVQLPELDGQRLAILGLSHANGATILQLLADRVTPEDDWEYIRAVRPLPAVWIHDSSGRWHATRASGGHRPVRTAREVLLHLAIVPPLDPGTPRIEVVLAGQSAEVRVRLPLRWT